MELCLQENDFLGSFDLIDSKPLDQYAKNQLNLYMIKINSNSFDYNLLIDMLIDPVIDFSISRKVKEKYKERPGKLSKKARQCFVDFAINNGELGELLLFCFLESHLGAPKILTKLELKTSTSQYVKGSDGVHFLELPNGDYQLIFGESKTYKDIKAAITDAFKSIDEFKNEINSKGNAKSGLAYEKGLISDNLFKETFSEEEQQFLEGLIYPTKGQSFAVDDAFGIFIGFQIDIDDEDIALPTHQFRDLIKKRVKAKVDLQLDNIRSNISKYKLQGHNFYIYVLPFTDIDKKRKEIIEEITK